MAKCKDCKWWVKNNSVPTENTCDNPKVLTGYNIYPDVSVPVDGVIIENDEGWAWLVGPEFGCVNFEAKV